MKQITMFQYFQVFKTFHKVSLRFYVLLNFYMYPTLYYNYIVFQCKAYIMLFLRKKSSNLFLSKMCENSYHLQETNNFNSIDRGFRTLILNWSSNPVGSGHLRLILAVSMQIKSPIIWQGTITKLMVLITGWVPDNVFFVDKSNYFNISTNSYIWLDLCRY